MNIKFSLYPNWKTILKKAWSLRFMALSGLCSGLILILPFYQSDIPRNEFSLLMVLCSILSPVFSGLAMVSRLVKQKAIDGE